MEKGEKEREREKNLSMIIFSFPKCGKIREILSCREGRKITRFLLAPRAEFQVSEYFYTFLPSSHFPGFFCARRRVLP
jgi:hypothetical protein